MANSLTAEQRAEQETLARLATSSEWQCLKAVIGRLADKERTHLSKADFQDLLTVGRAQGRVDAYLSLVAKVEKAPERASKNPKED